MTNTETYTKVVQIIAETLHIDSNTITPQSTFDSLGADSLDKLEIIMKLEESFGIEIPDDQAAQISTVLQAVEKIDAFRASKT